MIEEHQTGATFVFQRNFDDEVAAEAALRAAAGPRTYTEAELASAVAEAEAEGRIAGQKEGHAAGRAEALDETQGATSESLDTLIPLMTGFAHSIDQMQSALQSQMLTYATGVCEALFPQLVEHFSTEHVIRQIETLITRLQGRASLTIHLPEVVVADVRERLPQLTEASKDHCAIHVETDPDLSRGQARISWSDGFAQIDQSALTRAIVRDLHIAARGASDLTKLSDQE